MKVSILFEYDPEEVGYNGSVFLTRECVGDLNGLAQLFADAARASGFTYVEDVAFEKDDGSIVWGLGDWG
jgi:hypothetical protein